jgi:hypothetical protein
MTALILQRFARRNGRAEDVTIAQEELELAERHRFLVRHECHSLVEDPDTLQWVEVVEYDSALASDDHYLSDLVRVDPAHMNVADEPVAVSEGDEPDIVARILQDSRADRTHPLWCRGEKVVEDRDVVRREVPDCVHVVPNGPETRPSRVEVVGVSDRAVRDELADRSDPTVVEEGMAHEQVASAGIGQRNQALGVLV